MACLIRTSVTAVTVSFVTSASSSLRVLVVSDGMAVDGGSVASGMATSAIVVTPVMAGVVLPG